MSRSKRLNIVKERPRNMKKSTIYWRTIRRVIGNRIKKYLKGEDVLIHKSIHKNIVNDYNYSDYTIINSYIKGTWK